MRMRTLQASFKVGEFNITAEITSDLPFDDISEELKSQFPDVRWFTWQEVNGRDLKDFYESDE